MDHDMVVRQKMTERYLLNELDPAARDEFEEHFFDCKECALDVHAGALFVEQSKVVFGEKVEPVAARLTATAPGPAKPGWLTWLPSGACRARDAHAAGRDRVPESGYLSARAAGIQPSAGVAVGVGDCRHLRI